MESLPRDDVRLHLVADALRRQLVLILVITIAVAGAIAAYALTRPKAYVATARVLVRPLPGNPLGPNVAANGQQLTVAMETEAGIVSSPGVTQLVSDKLRIQVAAGTTAVKASVPSNTEIVLITYRASSATVAMNGAQAFAESFLSYRSSQANSTQNRQLDSLQTQLKAAAEGLKKATTAAASSKPPADAAAQVQLYTNRLATLQDSIGNLQVSDTDSGTVVTPASLPKKPAGLSPLLLIVAGAMIGLAGAITLAIWRERRDDRVRAVSETAIEDLPVLAQLPPLTAYAARTLADAGAGDALYDAYRRGRAGVIALSARPSTLVVSAATPREPVDEIAVNLALSLTSAGYRVTLVDGTLGQGDVAAVLGVPAGAGLSDALLDDDTARPDLIETKGLRLLRSGTRPEDGREFFASSRLGTLMAHLSLESDYVIVAAPSAATNDGNAVATFADSVLLVIADKHTTHREVADIVQRSRRLGVSLLGIFAITAPSGRRFRRAKAPVAPARPASTVRTEPWVARTAEVATEGAPGEDRSDLAGLADLTDLTDLAAPADDVDEMAELDELEQIDEPAGEDQPARSTTGVLSTPSDGK